MGRVLLFSFIFFSLSFGSINSDINKSERIEPKVGIFITSLHNLNITNSSFDVIFWSWFIHDSKEYKPYVTTEITNLKDIQTFYELENKIKTAHKSYTFRSVKPKGDELKNRMILSSSEKKIDNLIWNTQKFKATVLHNWDVKNYPFDKHKLKIKIEDADFDYRQLKFIPDIKNSKISKDVKLEGWIIKDLKIEESEHIMETTFGDPTLSNEKSSYSEFTATINIERDGLRDFINIFVPIYLAFFISWLGYFIQARHDTKVSLFLASIFMLIGNKYVIDSNMPVSSAVTLVDKVQILTFVVVTIFIFVVAISMFFDNRKNKRAEFLINRGSMLLITLLYLLGNIYLFKDIFS